MIRLSDDAQPRIDTEGLRALVERLHGRPLRALHPTDKLSAVPGLDAVGCLLVARAIEVEWSVVLDDQVLESLSTVDDLLYYANYVVAVK